MPAMSILCERLLMNRTLTTCARKPPVAGRRASFVALVAQLSCAAAAPHPKAPVSPANTASTPGPSASPGREKPSVEVTVPATSCEMTTTQPFEAGQLVHIEAVGAWSVCEAQCTADLRSKQVGPEGFSGHLTSVDEPVADASGAMTVGGFLISEAHRGALLASVGDAEPFEVGPSWTVKINKAAPLHFTINDNDCTDNRGTMTVRITAFAAEEVDLSLDERKRVLDRAFALGKSITGQAAIGRTYPSLDHYVHMQPDLAEERTPHGVRIKYLHAVYDGAVSWDITLDGSGVILGHSQSGYGPLMELMGIDGSGQPLRP
jgi:hypothetical protein